MVMTVTSIGGSASAVFSTAGRAASIVVPVSAAAKVAARVNADCSESAAATTVRVPTVVSFWAAWYSTSRLSPATSRSVYRSGRTTPKAMRPSSTSVASTATSV